MIFPDENLGPLLSLVAVYAITLACLLSWGWKITKVMRFHARMREAKGAQESEFAPREGRCILAGEVQYAEGADHAVRVEIRQGATERESSGSYSHIWREKSRTVRVHPFYVKLASGERVRVEPTEEVFLVDDMDGVIFYDRTKRDRVAELTEGERVFVEGVMSRDRDPEGQGDGYRDARLGWVVRAKAGSKIHLSTHPMEMRFKRWANFYARFAIGTTLMLVLVNWAFWDYQQLLYRGEVVEARYAGKHHYESSTGEGGTVTHWVLRAQLPWGGQHEGDIVRSEWAEQPRGEAKDGYEPIVVRHVDQRIVQFGDRATVHTVAVGVTLLGLLCYGGFFLVRRRRYGAWYEQPVVDRAGGRIHRQTGLKDKL